MKRVEGVEEFFLTSFAFAQKLDVIDERVRDVNLNYADILEQINETAAAATRELQHITKT